VDLFLDTSVLLSACASAKGASRFIIEEAQAQGWQLISALSVKPSALLTLIALTFMINWEHNSTASTYAHQANG
jgi:hypothetical protein